MRNPWLDIPLGDYEAHMALATVGQSRVIAEQLDALVRKHSPNSVAIVGCAGGNGFDCLVGTGMSRVVGTDVNPEYIEHTRGRYTGRIPGLELYVADVQAPATVFDPVDLIYVALVLEYVDLPQDELQRQARQVGFALVHSVVVQSPGGKHFALDEFRRA